jgi:cellulose synthase/poly-beta-1,6-N-acetylglucosamine synthase-like glycosyltransferase
MFVAALWLALCLFAAADLILSLYFFRHLKAMRAEIERADLSVDEHKYALRPLSVIVCGHNEAKSLSRNLPLILGQDYSFDDGKKAFEIIVANDASTDESASLLEFLSEKYSELRPIEISSDTPRSLPGKKFPLSKALEAAKYDWIVCIDADCSPGSKHWLKSLASQMDDSIRIVAGYGGCRKTKGLLNWFARYETMHTFLMYYSFNAAGRPYMAVGRNLAARKEAYLFAQQQKVWSELPSGDDDLLVQLCASSNNMKVMAAPNSFTWTNAKENWKDYIAQKRRHVSTGKYYSSKTKTLLGAYGLLKSLCWLILAVAIGFTWARLNGDIEMHYSDWATTGGGHTAIRLFGVTAIITFLFSLFTQSILLRKATKEMRESSSLFGWIGFFFCWMLYNAVLAPYILWKSRQHWK